MRFESLPIAGAVRIGIEPHVDERGLFARTFCAQEFAAHGLPSAMVQASISHNRHRGTVRGMHFQWPPSREGKLVRCVRGRLFDVVLDLRPQSHTYLRHVSIVLDEDSRDAVFIPPGVAHGFQTLADGTEVLYQMSDVYVPELSTGVCWDDPAFGIQWPLEVTAISERDAACARFDRNQFEAELVRRTRRV
jgi:dTDP-4-dehydrorhamnose 3,5-epimerase